MQDVLRETQRRLAEAMRQMVYKMFDDLLKASFNDVMRGLAETLQMSNVHPAKVGLDPYRVLGLDKTALDAEVKKRYRDLLKKLHPDTAGVAGTEYMLQVLNAAYGQISRERRW